MVSCPDAIKEEKYSIESGNHAFVGVVSSFHGIEDPDFSALLEKKTKKYLLVKIVLVISQHQTRIENALSL